MFMNVSGRDRREQEIPRAHHGHGRQSPEHLALPRMQERRLEHALDHALQAHVVVGGHQRRARRPQRVEDDRRHSGEHGQEENRPKPPGRMLESACG
jgi:hypothetical protein